MAEVRNNFIKSKMNKDLDARLVPSGEYRDALNVAVSKSEGDDVGALENVLGNLSLTDFGLSSITNLDIIGNYMDLTNNRIFVFITNYVDTSSDKLSNFASGNSNCYIGVYNTITQTSTLLVSGSFLNFSKTHPVIGVNLIDDLLFWTDDRNQPRKINIQRALGTSTYYTNEDQISVSKYYPYSPIDLYRNEVTSLTITNGGTSGTYVVQDGNETTGGTGSGLTVNVTSVVAPGPPTAGQINGIEINNPGYGYTNGDTVQVVQRTGSGSGAVITLTTTIISTMQDVVSTTLPDGTTANPLLNANWPGDPEYLKDKFLRFSYRFKFDDGEYSLIAPFTQECFVPQQDGYFIGDDEDKSYKSTEVEFMQNKINNIILVINSPGDSAKWNTVGNDLKVEELEIIAKQSNESSLKIIDKIPASEFINNSQLFYDYQSRKPWKTLPTAALLRVYDQTPVRALAQEVAGNRIIYGNFIDKHTPPESLNYNLNTSFKETEVTSAGTAPGYTIKEYQNHSLKQNRSYQVGLVLSDRYGRQSDTILSSVDTASIDPNLKGSTIFHQFKSGTNDQYRTGTTTNFSYYPASSATSGLYFTDNTWPGDSLKITFNDIINSVRNSTTGTPGIYKGIDGDVESLVITTPGTGYSTLTGVATSGGSGLGLTVNVTAGGGGVITAISVRDAGSGYKVGDVVQVVGGAPALSAELTITQVGIPNLLGWYSYKVVVKQTETDYYNVYFPGVLNGYIDGESKNPLSASLSEPVVHFALSGDNINKIPRDLSLVGPNQSFFRSGRPTYEEDPSYYRFSVNGVEFDADPYDAEDEALLKTRDRERDLDAGSQITNASIKLSPRVISYATAAPTQFSAQYYPGTKTDEVVTIGTGTELGLWDPSSPSPYNIAPVFYGYANNPYIAKIVVDSAYNATTHDIRGYGQVGPSPSAGKFVYKIPASSFTVPGNNYVAGSKNVSTTPNTVTDPGSGLLINIDSVNDGSGALIGTPGEVGANIDGGISIGNKDGIGIKGYEVGANQQHQLLAGDEDAIFYLNVTRREWGTNAGLTPIFSVYETEPIESKLDIYWESSTSGLISELNTNIKANDTTTPYSLIKTGGGSISYSQNEGMALSQDLTDVVGFKAANASGTALPASGTVTMLLSSVLDGFGNERKAEFSLVNVSPSTYKIQNAAYFYYGPDAATRESYSFFIEVTAPSATWATDGTTVTRTLELSSATGTPCMLSNSFPVVTPSAAGANLSPASTPVCGAIVTISGVTSSDQHVVTYSAVNGANTNDSRKTNDLTFSILSNSNPALNFYLQPFRSEPWKTKLYVSSAAAGLSADVVVKVVDAGGFFDTCTLDITTTA